MFIKPSVEITSDEHYIEIWNILNDESKSLGYNNPIDALSDMDNPAINYLSGLNHSLYVYKKKKFEKLMKERHGND